MDGPVKRWYDLTTKSQMLLLMGFVWCLIGYGVLENVAVQLPGVFHIPIPAPIRGALWIGPGLFAIYAALSRRGKSVALGLLQIMPVVRISSYLWAWLMWLIPGEPGGYASGWYQAAFHSVLVMAVWITASLPNRPKSPPQE